MKTLNRYIREQHELNISEVITEGRIKSMNETEWLNSLYGRDYGYYQKTYIQTLFDRVQTHALYGLTIDNVNDWKEKLKKNKGISKFRIVRNKPYAILCFHYDRNKDIDYKNAVDGEAEKERIAAEKFADEVKKANTEKYKTDQKNIDKMKAYFNKHSDPERLVKSIKDDNKLISRWIAAMMIDWPEAVSVFGYEISNRKLLTKAEIVAYSEKYKDQKVDDSDLKRLNKTEEKLASSWITKSVFKWMEKLPVEIEWVESFKNAKTSEGKDVMRRNGRAWTEGFVVKITKDGKSKNVTFDIVTNEGGGLYGYVIDYEIINFKTFKTKFENIISNI